SRNGNITIDANSDHERVLWHEIGHHIEHSNPHLLERAKAFIKSKTNGKVSYHNIGSRGSAEYLVRTDLSHGYMSKIYMENTVSSVSGRFISKPPALSNCRATEIFSMALQMYA
ncbi:TPA: hypothetical protein ACGGE6_004716, partial [Escherichia coli]